MSHPSTPDPTDLAAQTASAFASQKQRFFERLRELGVPEMDGYQWYHTVDLGDGLLTPGMYDYRDTVDAFGFPADMTGMRVLDIGSATGFFSFEFERRGARVTATELPSLDHLDRFPGQTVEQSIARIERMIFPEYNSFERRHTPRELYRLLLDGPFRFCHQRLRSSVERLYLPAYDISPETVGAAFDLVFIGDVLLHTLYPLRALAAAASVCRGTLIVAQQMPEPADGVPAMVYVGGTDPDDDHVSWWLPNKPCMIDMLRKLRFSSVTEMGRHTGVLRPFGYRFERVVLHAAR